MELLASSRTKSHLKTSMPNNPCQSGLAKGRSDRLTGCLGLWMSFWALVTRHAWCMCCRVLLAVEENAAGVLACRRRAMDATRRRRVSSPHATPVQLHTR